MAKWGCEFLADMKARTGFQSGYSMSGYLVVGSAEREAAIRAIYETMRERGVDVELCDVDRILELEPRLATARSHDRLLRADGRPRAAAVRRRRLRARRRARRRDAPPRHARDGLCAPTARAGACGSSDGTRASAEVVIVACGPWANKLTRGLGGVVPLALSRGQAGRFRPPHAFGPPGPDHLRPRARALDQARGQRRPLPHRRARRPPRPQSAQAPDGAGGSRRLDARDVRGRARTPLPGHGRRRLARLLVELLRLHPRRQPGDRLRPRPRRI